MYIYMYMLYSRTYTAPFIGLCIGLLIIFFLYGVFGLGEPLFARNVLAVV